MRDILVVEDDLSTRTNIADLLNESGYNVFCAEDGLSALSMVKRILPDLIISDVMMPEMDGIELLNKLSKESLTEDIPVIFLSARSEPSDIRKGMQLGADDYITKPFKALELLKSVETRLKKRAMREKKMKTLVNNIALSLPHELRTPLVAIMGYSQLLREEYNSMEKHDILEVFERIHYAGNRLNKTIQKFLIYSEIEHIMSDRSQLKRIRSLHCSSSVDIIKDSALKCAGVFSRQKDIVIDLENAPLQMNQTYLEYIISEVTENACKFSEPGSVIKVCGRLNQGYFDIRVSDQGRGMTLEQVLSIGACFQFDKEYFQQSGNGLGLAITKGLAELHNGIMNIESIKNEYTAVHISIPLQTHTN